jgi:hypothetical protein
MEWKKISGSTPTDDHYEAFPEPGIRAWLDPVKVNNWPAFRWSVGIHITGQRLYRYYIAVDLRSAKRCAENFLADKLPTLDAE